MGAECPKCGNDVYDECGYCAVVAERDRAREDAERLASALMETTRWVLDRECRLRCWVLIGKHMRSVGDEGETT